MPLQNHCNKAVQGTDQVSVDVEHYFISAGMQFHCVYFLIPHLKELRVMEKCL